MDGERSGLSREQQDEIIRRIDATRVRGPWWEWPLRIAAAVAWTLLFMAVGVGMVDAAGNGLVAAGGVLFYLWGFYQCFAFADPKTRKRARERRRVSPGVIDTRKRR